MPVKVVNKRTYKGDGVYVGRPSPLGNPFSHVKSECAEFHAGSRDEAVDKYEEWLRHKLLHDATVRNCFDTLVDFYRHFGELTLICWCVPEKCHASVLARMIEEAANA